MASLYVHIPYCEKKCIYCDFYSVESMHSLSRFLNALERETALAAERYSATEAFETIFLGGGTPSLLSPSTLESILESLYARFSIRPDAEITVETNPGTVDLDKLRGYRSCGVNRLSIGIQSFCPEELKFLGRIHAAEDATSCVEDAYRAGFENVSVDLIFSLPQQTREQWKETLRRAIALEPKHVSTYSLIVEEHTPLHSMVQKGAVSTLTESEDADLYDLAIAMTADHGFRQYEISNFAKAGYECRHNMNYWNHSNYVGLGPSAHSFWKDNMKRGRRRWNVRSIAQYCEAVAHGRLPIAGDEIVDEEKMLSEAVFLGLRTGELNAATLQQLYGIDIISAYDKTLRRFSDEGVLRIDDRRIKLTRKGFMICDAIAESLL